MLGLKMYDEAIKCYNIGLRLKPNDSDALNNKGVALSHLMSYERALKCFEECINSNIFTSDQNIVDVYINKGLTLTCLKRHEDAIKCFDQALIIDSLNSRAHKYKVASLCSLNKHDEAAECYKCVLKISDDEAREKMNKTLTELKEDEKEEKEKDEKEDNDVVSLSEKFNNGLTKNVITQSLPSVISNSSEQVNARLKMVRHKFRNLINLK